MARSADDSWDLATSVGATATMVAAARAAATRRPHPVITDEFAEPLVRAVGLDVFTRAAAGEVDLDEIGNEVGFPRIVDTFAARALFFDRYFAEAGAAGVRQVVIVASGLDARPYRLPWPAGTVVYEIDQPEVIAFKAATVAELGAVAPTQHRTVGIDLREDWPAALRAAGFDATQPTAWLAEGVLIGFLPPEAEVRLLDNVVELSAAGSRFAADYGTLNDNSPESQELSRRMTRGWQAQGLDMDIAGLTYPGEHTDVAAHLAAHGWQASTYEHAELITAAGLPELVGADQQGPAPRLKFVKAVRA